MLKQKISRTVLGVVTVSSVFFITRSLASASSWGREECSGRSIQELKWRARSTWIRGACLGLNISPLSQGRIVYFRTSTGISPAREGLMLIGVSQEESNRPGPPLLFSGEASMAQVTSSGVIGANSNCSSAAVGMMRWASISCSMNIGSVLQKVSLPLGGWRQLL